MQRWQVELELFFRVMQVQSPKDRQEYLEKLYELCTFENLQDRIAEEAENAYQQRVNGSALSLLPSKLESVTEITVNHARS